MSISLIVAAGGSGLRFRRSLKQSSKRSNKCNKSKLFFELGGKPILYHTLLRFQNISKISEIIVSLPKADKSIVEAWKKEKRWKKLVCVQGGKTRAESVRNGLRKCSRKNKWVMVHDGARPFVSDKSLGKLMRVTSNKKVQGAILAKKVIPTIKRVVNNIIEATVDRESLVEAQTPQLVSKELLKKAYENKKALLATDESSLLESVGGKVKVVTHDEWNPKITTAKDLEMAQVYFEQSGKVVSRVGMGKDIHRLVEGRKLLIGGTRIPSKKGALGHSDGDVLLHAIADAILGVIGEGDIGEHFSDLNKKNKGLNSKAIIDKVLNLALKKGWVPTHVDSVIVLEKPRLGLLKKKIQSNVSKLLKLKTSSVSIKAKTMEGLGPEGQGLALSCEALVSMTRKEL